MGLNGKTDGVPKDAELKKYYFFLYSIRWWILKVKGTNRNLIRYVILITQLIIRPVGDRR